MNVIDDQISSAGIVSIRDGLLERQAAGSKVYRLESGDPSFDVSPHIKEAIAKALADGRTHYTAGAGILPLREAICEKLASENKINVTPDQVLVTNGAMHGLYIVFRALDDGELIVPNPTWTETVDNIVVNGKRARKVPYLYDDLDVTGASAIVVNSPHNPTGLVHPRERIEELVEIADRNNLLIISDEAYEHVIYDAEHVSPASIDADRTISLL